MKSPLIKFTIVALMLFVSTRFVSATVGVLNIPYSVIAIVQKVTFIPEEKYTGGLIIEGVCPEPNSPCPAHNAITVTIEKVFNVKRNVDRKKYPFVQDTVPKQGDVKTYNDYIIRNIAVGQKVEMKLDGSYIAELYIPPRSFFEREIFPVVETLLKQTWILWTLLSIALIGMMVRLIFIPYHVKKMKQRLDQSTKPSDTNNLYTP